MVGSDYRLYLGNETDETMDCTACELFGFGAGSFESRIVRGGKRDSLGLAWRLRSDIELIAVQKRLNTVCGYLHQLATRHGIGEVSIEDHVLKPKVHHAAQIYFVEKPTVFEVFCLC